MMPKSIRLALVLALALAPLSGCVVRTPSSTGIAYTTSWIEQIKVQVEPSPAGPRVAAAPQSWHLIRLSVGRLDGSMPIATKTINPFDSKAGRRVLANLVPGSGYFIQASLIHKDAAGAEWEVARGQLGGDGESVHLNAGPNAVPIQVKPMVAGGVVSPTPSRYSEPSKRRSSGSTSIVVIDTSDDDEDAWEPEEDTYDEAPDAETIYDWMDDEGDEDEEESERTDDTGDWLGVSSALKVSRPL